MQLRNMLLVMEQSNFSYLIKDASELALLAKNVNEKEEKDKYYELISDIDLSGHFEIQLGM